MLDKILDEVDNETLNKMINKLNNQGSDIDKNLIYIGYSPIFQSGGK